MPLNVELTVTYSEALKYFPRYSEYNKNKKVFKEKNIVVDESVILSPDYSGGNKSNADLIVSFPNFKGQRVKNIISEIDETILLKPDDRLIWIIGDPNTTTDEATKRKEMMIYINEIQDEAKIYEVSTLFYKKTIEKLEHIYIENNLQYHINIADLGSKMQTLAIAIYGLIRPDISVYYTIPKTYGSSKYSEGVKDIWLLALGSTAEIMRKINSIDTLELSI